MFVITGLSIKGNKKEYVSIDSSSGGYPYWSSALFNAKKFNDIRDAIEYLNDSQFTRISKMNDGSIYPPRMLCEINMDSIKIEEIILKEIKKVNFSNVKKEYIERKEKYDKLKKEINTL